MDGEDDGDFLLGWQLQAGSATATKLCQLKLIDVDLSKYIFVF